MALGPMIRNLFGPYERQISETYRSMYIDIDAFAGTVQKWRPSAARILEVGCGEGSVTERLAAAYPDADITAIDISPRAGRLYSGPRGRVQFRQCLVQEIAAAEPGRYDLVMICDVLHHVPVGMRPGLLDALRTALAPGGSFIFKDWERQSTPIHWLAHLSDRCLSGDEVTYMSRGEMQGYITASFGKSAITAAAQIAPWNNNIAFLVQQ